MKKLITTTLSMFLGGSMILLAQERPKVQDLEFLIGTWEITFKFYDTHKPERGVIFTEKGTQTCSFDMPLNGVNQYITCTGELMSDDGIFEGKERVRTIRASIRYSSFIKETFERIGLYSNWPSTGLETFKYNPESRSMVFEGALGVQNGVREIYEDVYQFSEDYRSYTRRNIANFSDMPITEFNLTMEGTGRKMD